MLLAESNCFGVSCPNTSLDYQAGVGKIKVPEVKGLDRVLDLTTFSISGAISYE